LRVLLDDSPRLLLLLLLLYCTDSGVRMCFCSNGTNDIYYEETDKCTISPSWCSFNSPYPGYNPNGWINTYRYVASE
jgi:hypothetical protein